MNKMPEDQKEGRNEYRETGKNNKLTSHTSPNTNKNPVYSASAVVSTEIHFRKLKVEAIHKPS